MKFIAIGFLMISIISVRAAFITEKLNEEESEIVSELASKYEVPSKHNSSCLNTSFEIVVRGQSNARGELKYTSAGWLLIVDQKQTNLENKEITDVKNLFNRLEIPLERIDQFTLRARVMIIGSLCSDATKNSWSITFDDLI